MLNRWGRRWLHGCKCCWVECAPCSPGAHDCDACGPAALRNWPAAPREWPESLGATPPWMMALPGRGPVESHLNP
eukprot:7250144-Pyramimonas_sp.AAC.1